MRIIQRNLFYRNEFHDNDDGNWLRERNTWFKKCTLLKNICWHILTIAEELGKYTGKIYLFFIGRFICDYLVSYLGHSLVGGLYPSAKVQSVYSTTQADWAIFCRIRIIFLWIGGCCLYIFSKNFLDLAHRVLIIDGICYYQVALDNKQVHHCLTAVTLWESMW